eukprot:14571144-Ditylum_brightwellii.AAC.1
MQVLKEASKASANRWYTFISAYAPQLQNITSTFTKGDMEDRRCLYEYCDISADQDTLLMINLGGKFITTLWP